MSNIYMAPPRRLPLNAGDLLLILIVALGSIRLLGVLVAPSAVEFGVVKEPEPAVLVGRLLLLLNLQAACIMAAVYLVAVRWRGVRWQELGFRPAAPGWYRRAALLALLAFPLTLAVNFLVQRLTGGTPVNPQFDVVAPIGFSWFAFLGMLLTVGALVPIVEEVLFRGILYRWLRERWGVPGAAVVSALCFSVLHGIPWLIPAIAVLGILLAIIYENGGSVWPSVLAHGLYNSISVTLLYALLANEVPLS